MICSVVSEQQPANVACVIGDRHPLTLMDGTKRAGRGCAVKKKKRNPAEAGRSCLLKIQTKS
jgi:hypothetical protein